MKVYGKINGKEVGFCDRFIHSASYSYNKLESTYEQDTAFINRIYGTLLTTTAIILFSGTLLTTTILGINYTKSKEMKENKIERILNKN